MQNMAAKENDVANLTKQHENSHLCSSALDKQETLWLLWVYCLCSFDSIVKMKPQWRQQVIVSVDSEQQ